MGSDECFANALRFRCTGGRCCCGHPVVDDGLVNLEVGRLTDASGRPYKRADGRRIVLSAVRDKTEILGPAPLSIPPV